MNVFTKFDEMPSIILQILRKQNVTDTRSDGRSDVRSDVRTDNVKTVYPPTTNTVCGGINIDIISYLVVENVILRFRSCWVYPVG